MKLPQARLEMQGDTVGLAANCPEHGRQLKGTKRKPSSWSGKKSTTLRATQLGIDGKEYLVFRCNEKDGHLFNAILPSEPIPSTWAEVQAWMARAQKEQAGLKVASAKGA